MLDGDKNIKKEKQYEPKETTYEWEYGTVKKYQTGGVIREKWKIRKYC